MPDLGLDLDPRTTVPVSRSLLRAIEQARMRMFLASDAARPGFLLQLNDMLRQLPDADA